MTPADDDLADAGGRRGDDARAEPRQLALSAGMALSAARTALGRSIEEIAAETRVPQRHLRALEADRHDELPALPYAQGFVRSFAKAVKLDPDALAAQFKAETSKRPHVPSAAPVAPLDARRLPSRGVVLGSVAALVLVVVGLSALGGGAFDAPVRPRPVANLEAEPNALPDAMLGETSGQNSGETEMAAVTPAPAPAPAGPVVLEATEEVWVRVYEPGTQTVAMSGVMQPGERFEVPASPAGFRLWTGRAGALRLTVGGETLPPLGGAAEVIRDVSLVPADLKARTGAPMAEPENRG